MTVNTHQAIHFLRHFFTARRNGHGIHSPFAYRLCEDVFYHSDAFYDFIELQQVRSALLKDEQEITVEDLGAGSKAFTGYVRKIKDIAGKGISSVKQAELLYKLINFLNCRNSLELGTSIGLTSLYLARANKNGQLTTVEGSKMLYDIARRLAAKNNTHNIRFIHASFSEALPDLLNDLDSLDLFYVDGNHTREATLSYFHSALPYRHNNSLFVFDDIYWSKGMTEAWQIIKQNPDVTLSIDLFHFGLVFFRSEIREKTDLKLLI